MSDTIEVKCWVAARAAAAGLTLGSTLVFIGCMHHGTAPNSSTQQTFRQVSARVLAGGNRSLSLLQRPGPFSYGVFTDYRIPLSPTFSLLTDYYQPRHLGKSPLVVFVHGNGFSKEVHSGHGRRLASWGFHVLAIEVPNRYQWIANGRRVAKLVRMLLASPHLLSDRFDPGRILLVGHSFGGSAVSLAASERLPLRGLILLDPAVVTKKLAKALKKVRVPTIILGADPVVFRSRRRHQFFRHLAGPVTEITVSGATHNDAQLPSITQTRWGFDLTTSPKKQFQFLHLITSSAFSLGVVGDDSLLSSSIGAWLRLGLLKDHRAKFH